MSNKVILATIITLFSIFTGCATSQNVIIGQVTPPNKITTAALVPQDGNSPEMDSYIEQNLKPYGITLKDPLPAGTRQANDVDLIVSYSDTWRWDLVMYLQSITINYYDGPSGNLLVTGSWQNSGLHGFYKPQDVINALLKEIHAKMSAPK